MSTPTIQLADLPALHEPIAAEIEEAVLRVLRSGRYVGGDEVTSFERSFASYVGAAHAVSVSSGTDAILASLMALEVGPGDEVVTTPFTFAAPTQAIARVGARPVFVDVEPATFQLDPERLEEAIGPKTRGILPVHLFGQCAHAGRIAEIAARHDVAVIEDAAQAIGATHGGRHAGTFGLAGCFSFFPTKNLGGIGDGGMVVTDDEAFAGRLRQIRYHGASPKYVHRRLGGNFRLDAVQAAVLSVKLDHVDDWNEARRDNAAYYDEVLAGVVTTPAVAADDRHAYHQYVVRIPDRDRVRERLEDRGIRTGVYYPLPMHLQPCFEHLEYETGDFPEAERACREVLALPVHPTLTRSELERVADVLREEGS